MATDFNTIVDEGVDLLINGANAPRPNTNQFEFHDEHLLAIASYHLKRIGVDIGDHKPYDISQAIYKKLAKTYSIREKSLSYWQAMSGGPNEIYVATKK